MEKKEVVDTAEVAEVIKVVRSAMVVLNVQEVHLHLAEVQRSVLLTEVAIPEVEAEKESEHLERVNSEINTFKFF